MKPIRKDLVVTGRTLQFTKQEQTDAEGQVAVQQFHTRVGAGVGRDNDGSAGSIPGIIEYKSMAGELANAVRTCCQACVHFDRKSWLKYLSNAEGPLGSKEDRETINQLRGRLMMAGVGPTDANGEIDIEAALRMFGVCRPLSDIIEGWVGKNPIHWPAIVAMDANCPTYVQAEANRQEIVTPASPFGLFKPLDLDAQKIGAKRYDAVLHDAGRKTR